MTSSGGETSDLNEINIQSLPDETLVLILRHLHYHDLVSISKSCCRFRRLSLDDELWRWQCEHYFLEKRCRREQTWRDCFVEMYRDFGKYPDYREIKQAWNKIESFLRKRCPSILASLNEGTSEEVLDAFERRIQEKLPLDVRVSYRIRNGQFRRGGYTPDSPDRPGLMGGGMVTSHHRSDELMPFDIVEQTYKTTGDIAGCVMLTRDQIGHSMQLLAISNRGGFSPGHVYDATSNQYTSGLDCFVAAKSFKDWLCSYADKLADDKYHILHEYIFKFYHEPSCVATTIGITVKPYTCFVPELSCVSPPHVQYFFAYRIIIGMSEDTPVELSCRLETRHWIITDAQGKVTTVDGPGVVGEYPEMRPGKTFEWISCCTFDTPSGNMKGHFKFRNLQDGSVTEVECPCYHMKALPTLTARERQEIVKQLGLREPNSSSDSDSD